MLTKDQKAYIREQMASHGMPEQYKVGFVRWMIRIYKADN